MLARRKNEDFIRFKEEVKTASSQTRCSLNHSRHDKDFLRVRVLHFAPRCVSTHVHILARFVRAKNVTRFLRNRLGRGKLGRHCRRRARLGSGGSGLAGTCRRRTDRGSRPGPRSGRGHRPARCFHIRSRRRVLRGPVCKRPRHQPHWRGRDVIRSDRDFLGRAASGQQPCTDDKT